MLDAQHRPSPWRALRVRNFRLYSAGQLVSLSGTWAQRVAIDWLVLQLTNSGTALGIVTALQFLPAAFLSMYAGALADRFDKRKLLMATQTCMGLSALGLGVLTLSGVVQLWHVMVLAGLFGIFTAIDHPIRHSFFGEMVGPDNLPNAVAINSSIFSLARILGPAAAGAVIAAFGTGWAFVGNSATCLALIGGLLIMRARELRPAPHLRRAPGQYREAFRYAWAHRQIRLALLLATLVGTFGMTYQLTIALLAKQEFGRGAEGFGLLSTLFAVGATIGALGGTFRSKPPSDRYLGVAAATFGLTEFCVALMPTFAWTGAALIPAGAAMILFAQACNTRVQLSVDPSLRGRVMGLYVMCFMGGIPIGAPILGVIGEVLGPRWSMASAGGLCVAITAAIAAIHRLGATEGSAGAAGGEPADRHEMGVCSCSRGAE